MPYTYFFEDKRECRCGATYCPVQQDGEPFPRIPLHHIPRHNKLLPATYCPRSGELLIPDNLPEPLIGLA